MSFDTIDANTLKISKIYDENELSKIVFDTVEYYRKQAEHWRYMYTQLHNNTVNEIKEEFKDEINNLEKHLNLSYGEFASQKEKEAYDQFEKEHIHDRLSSKYNGGRAPYLIPTGTGIGTNLKVVCPICGESKDITDTSVW